MTKFIDKRTTNNNKCALNRQRFMQRMKKQIKEAISNSVNQRNITNFENSEQINISTKYINEPTFKYANSDKRTFVYAGNTNLVKGDKIKRQKKEKMDAKKSNASNQGSGNDDFVFQIPKDEYVNLFFDDLELPNLIKKQITTTKSYQNKRAGYQKDGVPTNINVVRTMRQALARRITIQGTYKRQIKRLYCELEKISANHNKLVPGKSLENNKILDNSKIENIMKNNNKKMDIEKIKNINKTENNNEIMDANETKNKIEKTKAKINKIAFIDPIDLRYNNRILEKKQALSAVMFCIMDVSGSMDETKKELAKRFFILLYLFLTKNYETIDIVFIRHHTSAKEVDEHDFFYSSETGGTVVSSALDKMQKIIKQKYSTTEWNIYAAQASDGDNWNNDSPRCQHILANDILKFVQYFAYVEIMPKLQQSLWHAYSALKATHSNFAMEKIDNIKDLWTVFQKLFSSGQEANIKSRN